MALDVSTLAQWGRSVIHFLVDDRGATFGVAMAAVSLLLPSRTRLAIERLGLYRADRAVLGLYALFGLFAVAYIAYPNYRDHAEPTVAALGQVILAGAPLYPFPESYPYYATVYGPLLAYTQAAVAWLPIGAVAASKIPGIVAFMLATFAGFRACRHAVSRAYLAYLLPFGLFLFWVRADPLLLLSTAAAVLYASRTARSPYFSVVLGMLAGAAGGMKLHAGLCIFAVFLLTPIQERIFPLRATATFAMAALISFLLLFAPSSVSLAHFVEYLRLTANQGFSIDAWLGNMLYLAFLWIPLAAVAAGTPPTAYARGRLLLLLSMELATAFIAAKPGAGTHHFMPFIITNAYALEQLLAAGARVPRTSRAVFATHAVYASLLASAAAALVFFVLPMIASWRDFGTAHREIERLAKRFPDALMGTSENGYPYAWLRVELPARQFDYTGYMDWDSLGRGDESVLLRNMQQCAIAHLIVPNFGAPMMMRNYYTMKPLFSTAITAAFEEKYRKTLQGDYFSVYSCGAPASPSIEPQQPRVSK